MKIIATKRDLVVVIPARGGSKRIKGKNIRPLAGKPLVHHAIEYALELEPRTIIVSTDSDEVAGVVRTRYPKVQIDRSFNHTDESTVDEVAKYFYGNFVHKEDETLVVIQPTMIGDVVQNIKNVLPIIIEHGGEWRLSGLRIVSSPTVGWWENIAVKKDTTLIDIDTMSDFAAAELHLRGETTIGIYYKAGERQGWGHEKRAKALADALQDYDVRCEPIDSWKTDHRIECEVMILDIGDTTEAHMMIARLYGKVITIEDNGPGARLAHASINPFTDLKYAVLRPEFYNLPEYVVRDHVTKVLITVGGQDNHDARRHINMALAPQLDKAPLYYDRDGNQRYFEFIKLKQGQMASAMLEADVVICAGGQTAYEAIKVGVPTIAIPALPTEAMRPHLSPEYGIVNLDIAPSPIVIKSTFDQVARDKMLREDMSNRMKSVQVGDGTIHIRRIIEDLCQP